MSTDHAALVRKVGEIVENLQAALEAFQSVADELPPKP
jgi:hypothetical protein